MKHFYKKHTQFQKAAIYSNFLIVLLVTLFTKSNTSAQVTITSPSLTVTACPSFPTAPGTLADIVISESAINDISGSGTLILSTTSTFQFTNQGSASVSGTDITGISLSYTNTTLTLSFTVSDTTQLDTITLSGIQIRGLVTATAGSNIIRNGGSSIINGDTTGTVHAIITSTDAPVLTSSLTAPAICSGTASNYNPVSTVPGTVFSWTRSAVSGISNAANTGTGSPLEVLNDTTTDSVNVTYTYTLSANGCINPTTYDVIVTVNPSPTLSSTLSPPAICSGTAFSYSPTSNISNTTFAWSRPAVTGISNPLSSGTDDPNEILTDTTALPVTIIYSYILNAKGCTNSVPDSVTVTVNPAPVLTSGTATTICNEDTLNHILLSNIPATYAWIANDNINTTGESLIIETNDTISNTITNNSLSIQAVNYTITPTSTQNCIGAPQSYTASVLPTPVILNNDSVTICSGSSFILPLTSNVSSSFTWIAIDNPNTSGESTLTEITDTINNTIINTTSIAQTLIYTVTPTSLLNSCEGTPKTVTLIISPAPSMTSIDTMTICSGSAVNIPLLSDLASTYTWVAENNGNTLGESTSLQAADTITDIIINTTDSTQQITYTVTPTSVNDGCAGTPQTVSIYVNPAPVANAGSNISICSGTIDSIGSIAISGYTYSWDPGTGLSDSTISNPGNTLLNSTVTPITTNYVLTTSITATGCQATDSVSITVNPQPVIVITNPSPVCYPNTIDITDSLITVGSSTGSAYSYWKDLAATDTLQLPGVISISDTNFIKITAMGGCSDIDSVIITINPAPSINLNNTLAICSGDIDSIGILPVQGQSYSWSPAIGLTDTALSNPTITTINNTNIPIITNYILTAEITATGCQSTDSILVSVNPQPALTINHPPAVCFPNTIDLTAATVTTGSTGGGTFTYWSDLAATDTLNSPNTIAVSDTNYIKVTATGGCTDIDSVITVVKQSPVANAGNDLNICTGHLDSIGTLSTSGYDYLWSPGTGINDSTISNPIITTVNNTNTPIVSNYVVITTLLATGCQSTDTVVVSVNPQPVLFITNPAPSCSSDSIDLTDTSITAGSTPGGTFTFWTNADATTPLLMPTAVTESDTNFIKLTINGGCVDIEPVITIINPLPFASFTGLNYSNCYNAPPQILTGTPAGGVFSGNGVVGDTFTASIAGIGTQPVTYTYTDTNGCSRSASQFVQILPPSNNTATLCMVTVDTISNHNIIYWDNTSYTNIDSFIIFRETLPNTFEQIGAVPQNAPNEFTDTTADPNTQSYRYQLQVRDTCGIYSPISEFHKTIYLSHIEGTFSWTHYEIENAPVPVSELTSYVLLRDGNSTGNWDVIGSASGSQLTITDADYSSYPNGRWRIETLWSISCTSTQTVNTTRSNIITDTTTANGLDDNHLVTTLNIYPNPYSQSTTIQYVLGKKSEVVIEIYNSIGQKIETLVNNSQSPGDYKYKFTAKDLGYTAGVYFVKLSVAEKTTIKRIIETE